LIDGRESALQSKQLIQLHTVPEAESTEIANFKLKPDFDHYKNVLVNNHNFHSIEKAINELKKKYETPEQLSLF